MKTNYQIGDRIDDNRYEIFKILRGGMAVVYVVYDHEFQSLLAAKTFQDEVFAANPAIAERFTQEALAWVNLDVHENVVHAEFVLDIAGKPFLFLEYVSGGDLGGWIGTPRLTEDLPQVLRFAIQFCAGMSHALSKGIRAHRDVKPENCLVTEGGTLKVTDFGLAKVFDEARSAQPGSSGKREQERRRGGWFKRLLGETQAGGEPGEAVVVEGLGIGLTRTGSWAGTATHMAPEQFDDFKHVDVRADIYAFGVMLFQMLTGRLPFVGRSWQELQRLHKNEPPPLLRNQSSAVNDILQKCLAKDPSRRFGDFDAVRERLAEVYQSLTGEPAPRPATGAELNAATWSNKGMSLRNLGRAEQALSCYERALESNPRHVEAWFNKGIALETLRRPEEALACYDRALELNPHYAQAWLNKGSPLGNLGKPEEALACYERALELNPQYAKAWWSKGSALGNLGRPEEALACFDRSLELNPRHPEAWFNKGIALGTLRRSKEALACYERALELNPRHAKAWFNKGIALGTLRRSKEALACYDRALELNPQIPIAWRKKGSALFGELGRPEQALPCYDRALELDPKDAEAWVGKGGALLTLGRLEEALPCYDRALELDAKDAEAWFCKGAILGDSRRLSEALACFENAQRLGMPQAAQCIADCRRKLGG